MSETPSKIRYPDPLQFEDTKWEKFLQGPWPYARCPVCGITLNYATYYCPQCGMDMRKDDVVHVVRCKDCKYCEVLNKYEFWCYGVGHPVRKMWADDYCSRGERRDDNDRGKAGKI
jgi:predicted amidophosphoribosyltransferase